MSIKEVLMRRDEMSENEADALIDSAKSAFEEALMEGDVDAAETVMEDYFGLENDWIDELFV
jgi:hypothetical protein